MSIDGFSGEVTVDRDPYLVSEGLIRVGDRVGVCIPGGGFKELTPDEAASLTSISQQDARVPVVDFGIDQLNGK